MIKVIDRFDGEYEFLSNFFYSPMYVSFGEQPQRVPTLEHAYQASKATNEDDRTFVLSSATPGISKKRGRQITRVPEWDDIKRSVMNHLLIIKFSNPALARKLLETGSAHLIEGNWWGDTYWGVCNGVGKNILGRLLMGIRDFDLGGLDKISRID